MTQAYVSDSRILNVQNGVELDETGTGNYSQAIVQDCYIGCDKYLPNIKKRSTGIEIKDPNIAYSNFSINSNNVDMNQSAAYTPFVDPDILPTGISVVAMHNQASSNGMVLNIDENKIDLIKGHQGIVIDNVVNANITSNSISNENALVDAFSMVGIQVNGGINNALMCNSAIDNTMAPAKMVAFACVGSQGITLTQNTSVDFLGSISILFDNGTDCNISYNNLETVNVHQKGLYYLNAQTGPQNLKGNDWAGDFFFGAEFKKTNIAGFSYCNSRYYVSTGANVANALNPVDQGPMENCPVGPDNWFTILEASEDDYTCGGVAGGSGTLSKNEADINLANGGTLNLSPGFKWSSEMGLIRKFTENPGLATGDAIINGFIQSQQGQSVAAMFAVRNGINAVEGSIAPAAISNIQSIQAQLETNRANMQVLQASIDSDPNAMTSFIALSAQTESLEQTLQANLTSGLNSMATNATAQRNANNSISSIATPCAAERYINGLYLETQFVAPRALSAAELEAVKQVALLCPDEGGNIVFLARAWYFLQTGVNVFGDCGSIAPPMNTIERDENSLVESANDIVLMPNPADDIVQVEIPANWGDGSVTIIDIWGRVLIQQDAPNSQAAYLLAFSTKGLVNGIYVVTLREKTGKSLAKKLTITH